MNSLVARRRDLMDRLQKAERSHAPRSHIRRDLTRATTKQIKRELRWQFVKRIFGVAK